MPVAAYNAWQSAGRPIVPAQHIREFVDKLKAAFPAAAKANLFSWYADESHYTAVPAEDHTPFSQTGWPGISPQWYVLATDVMHRPDLGVDCNVLFPYWLGEAIAGRMPWLKYVIWQAKLYDVRNGWKPTANSGHDDHIHLSGRTDYVNVGIGPWSPIPGTSTEEEPMLEIPRDTDGTMWVSTDRITRRRLVTDNDVKYFLNRGATVPYSPLTAVNGAPAVENILEFGVDVDPIDNPPPPLVLTEADLEQIRQAAKEGAAAGADAPNLDEIRTVVDQELDEQSRAGADQD